jgi:hypothetical protein
MFAYLNAMMSGLDRNPHSSAARAADGRRAAAAWLLKGENLLPSRWFGVGQPLTIPRLEIGPPSHLYKTRSAVGLSPDGKTACESF